MSLDTHRPARSWLATAVQVVMLLVLLTILAGLGLMLVVLSSLINVPGQVAGGVGASVTGVTAQASRAVSGAQQAFQNATDPTHPPAGLVYDTEFSALVTWHVGDHLPTQGAYDLTLQAIQRRASADSPDVALFAVVHAQLRQPRETRLLGQLIRSDADPHDYPIYKGETFRAGQGLFRVNWVSQDANALAAGVYRTPDTVSAPLQFDYD